MRFVKLNSIYPAAAAQFAADNPDLSELRYDECLDRLVRGRYQVAHAFVPHLRSLGYDAHDLFPWVEPLQKQWRKEWAGPHTNGNAPLDILLAQIRQRLPDVVFLQDLLGFDSAVRRSIRHAAPNAALIGWLGVEPRDPVVLADVDLILTAVPNLVNSFRRKGARAELLRFAFEESVLVGRDRPTARDIPFAFVGNVFKFPGLHAQRHAHLEALLVATPLQVWGDEAIPEEKSGLARVAGRVALGSAKALRLAGMQPRFLARLPFVRRGLQCAESPTAVALRERFAERFQAPVFGEAYYDLLSRTQVLFNNHVDSAGEFAGNVRLFEATGMGACLLTDWKGNLGELFEPGSEVIAYRTIEEAIGQARDLIGHPARAAEIGAAGQRRTLRDHTYRRRTEEFVEILKAYGYAE